MSKHTPGPWYFFPWHPEWSERPRYAIGQADGAPYTSGHSDVADTNACDEIGTQLANARLIAAAPELLAVVRELLDMWLPDGERERIEALLARIDGDEEVTR